MVSFKIKLKFLIIRKIFPLIFRLLFYLVPRKERTLLVIKNDGIGDYILFRNFLHFLRNSNRFRGYKIYVLANVNFRDLAAHLDSDAVDGFFWFSEGFFIDWKLTRLMFDLQCLRLSDIIYPNYSRKYTTDWMVHQIKSARKIAVDGNLVNQSRELKLKTDRYYTQLISVSAARLHEFERNKEIFELITGEKCAIPGPFIETNKLNIIPDDRIVIFTGASDVKRRWGTQQFRQLCQQILSASGMAISLAGGKDEIKDGGEIEKNISSEQLSNQVGKITLIRLCELIGGARLLISGDTVAIHIAAALNVPAICLSRGDLYGRFIPYPAHLSDMIRAVYPADFSLSAVDYDDWSTLDINDISAEKVYAAAEPFLKSYQSPAIGTA